MSIQSLTIRNAFPEDHQQIIDVIPEWLGDRALRASVSKLFLIHFSDTCFMAEKNGRLAGFLIGFLSQAQPDEAYIHFVGVDPDSRMKGTARMLYRDFYNVCRKNSRTIVRSSIALENKASIEFHFKMGFEMESGDREIDGIQVSENYLYEKDQLVLFKKELTPA